MSIELSLYITQSDGALGHASKDELHLAYCRATMPASWWCLFAPEEIVTGPYGPMMRAKATDALERIRAHAPRLRAVAGRHALGLRKIERELELRPAWWLMARIDELYYSADLESMRRELVGATEHLGRETLWVTLTQGRFVRSVSPTHQLSDHIVGAYEPSEQPPMSWEELLGRCNDALARGDAADLDLLEEALFLQQREELGAFDKILDAIEPRRYVNPQAIDESAALLDRWGDGDQAALTDLSRWQIPALEEAAKRKPYEFSCKLRSRLRKSVEPLEGLLARALHISCPMSEALGYALWERGDQAPIGSAHERAVVACRLVATGAPASPLCLYDPLAIAERAAFSMYYTPLSQLPSPFEIAISRALRVTRDDIAAWLSRYPQLALGDYDEAPYEVKLSAALCTLLRALELPEQIRAKLRAIEEPPEAALFGTARELVSLALGEESCLEPLLEAKDVDKNALVASLYASRQTTKRSIDWIKAQVLEAKGWSWEGKLLALTSLLGAGEQEAAIEALREVQDELSWHIEAFKEGLITDEERQAYERALRALREALRDKHAPIELIERIDAALSDEDQAIS